MPARNKSYHRYKNLIINFLILLLILPIITAGISLKIIYQNFSGPETNKNNTLEKNAYQIYAQAQEATPTFYCVGGIPCGTITPSTNITIPVITQSISPSPTVQNLPTTNPCTTKNLNGTNSIQDTSSANRHRGGGFGGFLQQLIQFIIDLINKLLQLIGGGIIPPIGGGSPTPTPTNTTSPSPSVSPTGTFATPTPTQGGTKPTPTTNPCPSPSTTNAPSINPSITPSPTVFGTTPTFSPSPTQPTNGQTPVDKNGKLSICGTKICNQSQKPIQLRGMSSHGLQWLGWGKCITGPSLNALANDWKVDVVRIALYVQEGGYETDPAGFKTQVDTIVDEAVKLGLYVIIDWHILNPGDPNQNLDRAKEFFTYMSQKHGNKPNVIFELANEPNGVTWASIKSYAEQIIPVIRQSAPSSIIIVGTRGWSSLGISDGSNSQEIISSQVNGANLMYAFHFYAASHLDNYRNELSAAADKLPIFVTEWGTQTFSGDGANDFASSQAYIDLMANKQISWTNWNFSDDPRSGSVFNQGTCPNGPWTGTTSLKPAGVWIRQKLLGQ